MNRFMIFGTCAIAALATSLASRQAQGGDRQAMRARELHWYGGVDLSVTAFEGAYRASGNMYHVGGTVRNVGHGAYTRAWGAVGARRARQVQLYAINPTKGLTLLRTVAVPSLKAGASWPVAMTVSPREVPGTGNARFVLMLTAGDADRENDSKRIEVPFVH